MPTARADLWLGSMSLEAKHQPPEFAKHWAKELGSSEKSLVQLRGGINNRVFRCGEAHNQWIIKGYSPLEPDERDRMQAEVDFLRYSAQAAPGFTPGLIHADSERRCVVLENISGTPFTEVIKPSQEAIDDAVNFIQLLNADSKAGNESILIDAADGFLSLSDHLTNLYARVALLECDHLHATVKPRAVQLLTQLKNQLDQTKDLTNQLIDQDLISDSIMPEDRWISPSDFGFHNSIHTANGVKFIDFEFSGWDDPLKTAADFVLQPHFSIISRESPLFFLVIDNGKPLVRKRYGIMRKIMFLKWISIILGVLNPIRLDKILELSVFSSKTMLVEQQFRRVENYLSIHNHLWSG